uniref:LPS-assembly protein LptD n=1 Tax=Candidatus Kentrum eta TaxID=2126337 RepID=A0A450V3J3_9GAMM|nr:MAG: LPS-assembly protein [Candidatus Kentron sp. H]VFJ99325.1 MAG: LPS-assembly protein [Candidatus Kentron sp. H]VFK03973.1 MAG: LPS-assembly protein [Candidatus Kentron sp. H]
MSLANCPSRTYLIYTILHTTLHFILTIFFILGLQTPVLAGTDRLERDWSLCESDYKLPARPIIDAGNDNEDATYLFGDEADLSMEEASEGKISTLLGNVQVRRGTQHISADRVQYSKSLGAINAQGNVQVWDIGRYIAGESAYVNLASNEYLVKDVKFLLMDRYGRGTAEEIEIKDSNRITAKNATYTTCPGSNGFGIEPSDKARSGTEDWQLRARKLKLDKAKEWGIAHGVTIQFKNVPVLYSPYVTFPLSDKRKTGFLIPSLGASESTGSEVTVPFYWNIAPNQDATFAVRKMTERGTLLQGEYRYLTRVGTGKVGFDYLPHDNKYHDYRAVFRFQHTGTIARKWDTNVDFNWVSDENYFEDLGNSMARSSTRFLEQSADVHYSGDRWWAMGRLQGYQTIDETIQADQRPYDRLPQLQFGTQFREQNRKINFQLKGESVHFHRQSGVTGQRLDITPSISYPLRTPSAFLVPKLSLRHTLYNLDGTDVGKPTNPMRTLPIFSVDSGLFLERSARFGSRAYVHTLEPRLYYLAVPFEDQSDLPVFDTGEYTFNFGKMFRDNRFSGTDRVGDANQVALAVTTRLLEEETAEETFRASIGQIYYLRDRKVHLDLSEPVDTDDSSEIIAEVAARAAGKWRIIAGLQYDVGDDTTTKSNLGLRYEPDGQHIFNIGYRYDRTYDEQATTSFRWPLTRNWSTVGRWIYALPESRTVEAVAGLEYNSCCWAARAVIQRFLNGTDEDGAQEDFNNAFLLQLELKGLAGVGRKTAEFLTEIVPGYQSEF